MKKRNIVIKELTSTMRSEELNLEIYQESLRRNFLKYTKKAFEKIPVIDQPLILDIGCGSGVVTIDLALQSKGKIIAIDIDEVALKKLRKKIEEKKLNDQITVKRCSFKEMEFPDETFDIIWAEGVGGYISIDQSMNKWKRFLKPKGFLVLHDDAKKISSSVKSFSNSNFKLKNHFMLPDDVWWTDYYHPLEKQIKILTENYKINPTILKSLKKHQKEVDTFKKHPQRSGFVILQKK